MTEKLQKILSRAGIASRRSLESMILEGRVIVNGQIATVGDRYEADSITVKIDGRTVFSPETQKVACRVLMYHKPEGELTTLSDPENRPTVYDHIPTPPSGRWIYIGRLDINTSGLLLFTTDGELANALMHPKYEVERVYAARIYGEVTEEQLSSLLSGVMLEDGKASFSKINYVGGEGRNAWYHVTLKEGRKREVRRLWEAVGLKVSRLIRIKYAGIDLDPNLKTGQFRELSLNELNRLRKAVRLDPIEELAPSIDLKAGVSKFKKNPSAKPKVSGLTRRVSSAFKKDDNKKDFKKSGSKPYGSISRKDDADEGFKKRSFVKGRSYSREEPKNDGFKGRIVSRRSDDSSSRSGKNGYDRGTKENRFGTRVKSRGNFGY